MKLLDLVFSRKWIFFLLGALVIVRLGFFYFLPVGLWNSSDDYPVMSLAHAVYLDERLSSDMPPHVGYAQTTHPGIPFQIVSWLIYRISDANLIGSFETRIRDTISDGSRFWMASQLVPFITLSIVFIAIWRSLVNKVPVYYALLLPLIYLSYGPVWAYGLIYLGNDTFALPLGITLFVVFLKAHRGSDFKSNIWWLVVGMVGGLSYLNKLNYIMWSIGMLCGYVFACSYLQASVIGWLRNLGLFLIGFVMTTLAIGGFYLGQSGLKEMLIRHKGMLTHSGLYGSGEALPISLNIVLDNIYSCVTSYPIFWILFFVMLFQAFWVMYSKKKDCLWMVDNLPIVCGLFGAALMAGLATSKHYKPHYLIPLVVIMVCLGWWAGTQATSRYQRAVIVPFVILAFISALIDNISLQLHEYNNILLLEDEIAQIKGMPLHAGETRLWSYHINSKIYMQYFMASLAESPKLNQLLDEINPEDKHFDIFGRYEVKTLEEMHWRYAIFQTNHFDESDKLPEYFRTHGEIIKKFEQLLVVEHTITDRN